ncbi:Hypothetical protein SRAE_1000344900 [Strongyloides ratti]|uniref:Uncharacterized protein n=1 Tax=Strongyloides ratti TaxID=34506 RepID=A0A090L611_STRRB|nr:Hypothetical protein SRAE_1000344900 [Strongyloides ratti]CEF65196.1 Hypothetical protein SRAE_1000344900 [Strongyloides ratti]
MIYFIGIFIGISLLIIHPTDAQWARVGARGGFGGGGYGGGWNRGGWNRGWGGGYRNYGGMGSGGYGRVGLGLGFGR